MDYAHYSVENKLNKYCNIERQFVAVVLLLIIDFSYICSHLYFMLPVPNLNQKWFSSRS